MVTLVGVSAAAVGLAVQSGESTAVGAPTAAGQWVNTWTSMPQLTEPGNMPPPFTQDGLVMADTTLRQDWAAEEYTRGCYGAFTTPNTLTRFGHTLRAPIGPLHWAGTETATHWPGYMDGAAESGHRTATEAIAALRQP